MSWGKQLTSSGKNDISGSSALPGYQKTLRTILVATDLSARSDRALRRALQLAEQHGANVVVSHVFDEDLPGDVKDGIKTAAIQTIETALSNVANSKNIDVSVNVSSGSGHHEILSQADTCDADVIVVGTHRNQTPRFSITGTTMERVIRGGATPTLVVANPVHGPYEKVMAAVDFSAYSRFAIRNAVMLAGGNLVDAVHAYHVPFAGFLGSAANRQMVREEHERDMAAMIEDEMRTLLDASVSDVKMNQVLRHGEVHGVLRQAVKELKTDLMVMGTHSRVGLAQAVLGSVAEAFLNDPPCDVLVVKAW